MTDFDSHELQLLTGVTTYKDVPEGVVFAIVHEDGQTSSLHEKLSSGECVAMIYYFNEDGKFDGSAGGIVRPIPDPDTRVQVLMIAEYRRLTLPGQHIAEESKPSLLRRLFAH